MDRKLVTRVGSSLPSVTVALLALASAALVTAQDVRSDGAPAQPDKKGSYTLLDPKTAKLVSPMDVDASTLSRLPPGKVQGDVKTIAGAKFSGVKLSLCNAKTGDVLMTTATDAEGHYGFSNVPAGRYVLYFPQQNVAAVLAAEVGVETAPLNVALDEIETPAPTATWVPEAVSSHPVLAGVAGGVVVGGAIWAGVALSESSSSSHNVISTSTP